MEHRIVFQKYAKKNKMVKNIWVQIIKIIYSRSHWSPQIYLIKLCNGIIQIFIEVNKPKIISCNKINGVECFDSIQYNKCNWIKKNVSNILN